MKTKKKPMKTIESIFKIETNVPPPDLRAKKNNPFVQTLIDIIPNLKDGESIYISSDRISLGGVNAIKQEFNKSDDKRYLVARFKKEKPRGTRLWMRHYV